MLRFYKSTTALYVLFCVISAGLTLLFFHNFQPALYTESEALKMVASIGHVISTLVILFVLVPVSAVAANMIANKKYNKIMRLLTNDCDPFRFLEENAALLHGKHPLSPAARQIRANMLVGYHNVGDFSTAIQNGESICIEPIKKTEQFTIVVCHLNLCIGYYMLHDRVGIERHLQEAIRLIQSEKKALAELGQERLAFVEALINIENGSYDAAAVYFEHQLHLAQTCYDQVKHHYYLATICEKKGNDADRRQHLAFVAQYGNRLAIADEARNILSETA